MLAIISRKMPVLFSLLSRDPGVSPRPRRAWGLAKEILGTRRSGRTRAAISRLENGWNLNPTLKTLFRYAEALGVKLSITADDPAGSGRGG